MSIQTLSEIFLEVPSYDRSACLQRGLDGRSEPLSTHEPTERARRRSPGFRQSGAEWGDRA